MNHLFLQVIKFLEFFDKPSQSGVEKHPNFEVTTYLYFDTTNVDSVHFDSDMM